MSSIETIPGRPALRLRGAASILTRLREQLRIWRLRRRTRLHLLHLSDHQLEDLGLTREAALEEAMRPFWYDGSRRKGGA
ncbi:MAG: hypothetical protein Tsb0019_33750 [Roseibium sp.]